MMRAIRRSAEAGEFATMSEAMRHAVRAWLRQRLEYAGRLEALRARVRHSPDDPRPGISADEAEAEMARFMSHDGNATGNACR